MEQKYNVRSPGIKRLMREALELAEPTEEYSANPLDDNLFEWHFTVRGPPNSDFQDGIYHGRIILPTQYPMKPPDIILLTPNGRFETNKKICLSISGHHPESWQPSWSIRTALLALIAFMPTKTIGAIGSLEYTSEERQILAKKSRAWVCDVCGKISDKLSSEPSELKSTDNGLMKEIAELQEKIEQATERKNERINRIKLFEPVDVTETDSDENLIHPDPEDMPPSELRIINIRDQVIPVMIFFLVITIVVLTMRRFWFFSYASPETQSNDMDNDE